MNINTYTYSGLFRLLYQFSVLALHYFTLSSNGDSSFHVFPNTGEPRSLHLDPDVQILLHHQDPVSFVAFDVPHQTHIVDLCDEPEAACFQFRYLHMFALGGFERSK